MNLPQATSLLRRECPECEQPRADKTPWSAPREPGFHETTLDEYAVAHCVAKLLIERKNPRVQHAFNLMETILASGDTSVRDWVCGFLRALQDVAGWRASGYDGFVGFLQPETRRAWFALEAIQTDLTDCSILEEEITMWRVVHHAA